MALAAFVSIGPRIVEYGGQAWEQATQAADTAAVYWAAAPRECKDALIFAGNICGGIKPLRYLSPGFGPLALAWGWLLVGVLIGLLLGLHFWDIIAGLEKFAQRVETVRTAARNPLPHMRPPPGLHLLPAWHAAACNALAVVPEGPQKVVLRRLVEDGDAALELLVASAGVSRRAALARVLGEHIVAANAHQWDLL